MKLNLDSVKSNTALDSVKVNQHAKHPGERSFLVQKLLTRHTQQTDCSNWSTKLVSNKAHWPKPESSTSVLYTEV